MILTDNIKVLTHEQEKLILDYVMGLNTEDAGCARMVFPLDDELAEKIGLDVKFDCIVKLAMGIGGYRQNQLEIKTYLNDCEWLPLAEIVAYGRFVEIMERVEVEDWRDFYDDYSDVDDYMECMFERREGETDEECEKRYQKEFDEVSKAINTIDTLNDYFGYTGDNGQIGRNRLGEYVAYDYGYTTDRHTGEQVSDISDVIYDKEERDLYIQGLFDLLDKEEQLLEEYENRFLHDENGDGSYTRYRLEYVRHVPQWMEKSIGKDYECGTMGFYRSLESIKRDVENATDDWRYYAYRITEVVYNYDDDSIRRQVIIEQNIPEQYKEILEKSHQNQEKALTAARKNSILLIDKITYILLGRKPRFTTYA